MTEPTNPEGAQDIQDFINDPTQTAFGVNAAGDILITEDGTYVIMSSTLRVRGPLTSSYRAKRFWLQAPPPQARKR